MGCEQPRIIVYNHSHQPPREARRSGNKRIVTSIDGIRWTLGIIEECYAKLADPRTLIDQLPYEKEIKVEGAIAFNKFSFDITALFLEDIKKIDLQTYETIVNAMKTQGVGSLPIHVILPDMTRDEKKILIQAGIDYFKKVTGGVKPRFFWPPETALDKETLEVLAEYYEGVICAPEQLLFDKDHFGQPAKIILPSGKIIIAIPFDREISRRITTPELLINADDFAEYLKSQLGDNGSSVKISACDTETFNHHIKKADEFLLWLLYISLNRQGIEPMSINDLKFDLDKMPVAELIDRTSWSCGSRDLTRWHGFCGHDEYGCNCRQGRDISWKEPYYQTFKDFKQQIVQMIQEELSQDFQGYFSLDNLITLMIQDFWPNINHQIGLDKMSALTNAYISALLAMTSCATYFPDIDTSGWMNILHAMEAISYLEDAGLIEMAGKLRISFFEKLNKIKFARSIGGIEKTETALDIVRIMLEQNIGSYQREEINDKVIYKFQPAS